MVTWFVTWVLMFLLLWLHTTMKILLSILTSELITQDQTERLWVQDLSSQRPAPCQAPPILHTQGVGIYSENPWRLTFKLFYSENQTRVRRFFINLKQVSVVLQCWHTCSSWFYMFLTDGADSSDANGKNMSAVNMMTRSANIPAPLCITLKAGRPPDLS